MENLVVDGYTVAINANGGWSPGDYSNFTAITESFSDKVKAENKKVLKGAVLSKTAVGCSFSGYTFVSGVNVINKNVDKSKVENEGCFKKGATGNCAGGFTLTASPFTPLACSCSLEIDDAGQTKVKTK